MTIDPVVRLFDEIARDDVPWFVTRQGVKVAVVVPFNQWVDMQRRLLEAGS